MPEKISLNNENNPLDNSNSIGKAYVLNRGLNPISQIQTISKGVALGAIKPLFYRIDRDKAKSENLDYEDYYEVTSNLTGKAVYDAIIFKDPNNNDTNTITEKDLKIGVALISASQEKNIVKTQVIGREGTVNTYVNKGNWNITIKGVVVNPLANKRPSEDLRKLDTFAGYATQLTVISNFLLDLDVKTIIIENVSYEQREGMRNVYDYTLTCFSEIPFVIQSNNA
jgi:hypothetical protein